MKTRSILMTTLCSLMLGMSFTACEEDFEDIIDGGITDALPMTLILNEGSWGANNACIAQAFFERPAYTIKEFTSDIYLKTNGAKMGDLANAMIEEDDNLYVVMNGSKYVSRLVGYADEEARYTFPESEGAPRCIDVEDGYAYVTQHGGQVSKLNIKDMTLVSTWKGGENLEGIVEKDGKLYVANSYKVDGSGNFIYNKELYVIDAKTMKLEKTIEVVDNPTKMYEIDGKIYLLSQGNYYDVEAALQIIDPTTGTARKITSAAKITEGNNDLIYGVSSSYNENWELTNNFFVYNPKADEVSPSSFLQDAPASFKTDAIYLLEVDEESGFIYVGTSDYTTNGTIYQFNKSGKFVQSFDSGGINPSTMVFVD